MPSPITPFVEIPATDLDALSPFKASTVKNIYNNAKLSHALNCHMPYVLFESPGKFQSSKYLPAASADYVCLPPANGVLMTVAMIPVLVPSTPELTHIGWRIFAWRHQGWVSEVWVSLEINSIETDIGYNIFNSKITAASGTNAYPPNPPSLIKASRMIQTWELASSTEAWLPGIIRLKFDATTNPLTDWQVAGTGLMVALFNPEDINW